MVSCYCAVFFTYSKIFFSVPPTSLASQWSRQINLWKGEVQGHLCRKAAEHISHPVGRWQSALALSKQFSWEDISQIWEAGSAHFHTCRKGVFKWGSLITKSAEYARETMKYFTCHSPEFCSSLPLAKGNMVWSLFQSLQTVFKPGAREDVWDGTKSFSLVCLCVHMIVKYLILQNHYMHKVKSFSKHSHIAGWGLLVTCHRK